MTEKWFDQLLREAKFGPVQIGVGLQTILNTLGPPENVGQLNTRLTIISYKEKSLQLTFRNNLIVHFGFYFKNLSSPYSIGMLSLSTETTPAGMCSWMRDAGFGWVEKVIPNGLQIRFSNSLVATFEDGKLDSLQVSSSN